MMRQDNNQNVFITLLKAGLWETDACLLPYVEISFDRLYQIAEEQALTGIISAGLEHVMDMKIPQEKALQFAGRAIQIEQHNKAMNDFIWGLIERMRREGIYAILVKGQGLAQCYERPLLRICGDIDFLLSESNYENAKKFLLPLSTNHDSELSNEKHISMTIGSWVVELHGNLPSRISSRADNVLESVQRCIFYEGSASSWRGGKTDVFLLHPNENVIFVFTHILKHYFRGGVGLKQICDWCRLLWTYHRVIDKNLLEKRLNKMRFLSEWKILAAVAVDFLGLPAEAMPLYAHSKRRYRKARLVIDYIFEVGNFGYNRDNSFRKEKPFIIRKSQAFCYKFMDFINHIRVFPLDSLRVLINDIRSGIVSTFKHEG